MEIPLSKPHTRPGSNTFRTYYFGIVNTVALITRNNFGHLSEIRLMVKGYIEPFQQRSEEHTSELQSQR